MPPVRLVLGILLVALTALPTSAEELSLRERVERARAAARERAREERKEEAAAEEPSVLDPEADPELWRVTDYGFISPRRARDHEPPHGRFYCKVPEGGWEDGLTQGTSVFFYLDQGGRLELAGRGELVKVLPRHHKVEAEAKILRFTTRKTHKYGRYFHPKGVFDFERYHLAPDKHPHKVRWYASTKLKGPDVEGWDADTYRRFALGQPWMGMPAHLLEAMLGPPEERVEAGPTLSLVYGTGPDAMRYDITNGVVTGRTPVNQF